ncbi:MAG: PEGA domain-containing protein, partial [Deltaproteobacteria bacterium]|nr:PEGA domain-containing protein [Deltaproteobacteria bacterium]
MLPAMVWTSILTVVAAAVAIDPEAARKYDEAGQLSYDRERFDDALEAFQKAYSHQPLPGLLFNIGQCHRKLGQVDAALEYFGRYLAALPNTPNRLLVEELIAELEIKRRTPSVGAPAAPDRPASLPAPRVASGAREVLVAGPDLALVLYVCRQIGDRVARPATDLYQSRLTDQAAAYADALASASEAQQDFRRRDVERAWERVDSAIEKLERAYHLVREDDRLARVYLLRADLASARGATAIAEESFQIAARLSRDLQLDPATTSPAVIENFHQARLRLSSNKAGGLTVVSSPPKAMVWVDGVERGQAPLSLMLPSGPHLVSVFASGRDAWAAQVVVSPDDVRRLEVHLVSSLTLDSAVAEPTPENLRALRALDSGRDWLVLQRAGSLVNFFYLTAAGDLRRGGPVAPALLPAAIERAPALAATPAAEPLPHWGWIAAGAGGGVAALAGIGAGAIEGVFAFTDLGSGEERLAMQHGERILLGVTALGLAAGVAGAILALVLPRGEGQTGDDSQSQPAVAAKPE